MQQVQQPIGLVNQQIQQQQIQQQQIQQQQQTQQQQLQQIQQVQQQVQQYEQYELEQLQRRQQQQQIQRQLHLLRQLQQQPSMQRVTPQEEVAATSPSAPSGSSGHVQSNATEPTPEQALQIAVHDIGTAHNGAEVSQVVCTLAIALGASRTEVGTVKALHAVLLQLARPGMSSQMACASTGASKSNFAKWRRRVQLVQESQL